MASRISFISALFFVLISITGCGKERLVDKAAREGLLIIDNGSEPKGLDPNIVTGIPEYHILMALFEGLVIGNPDEPGGYLPGVADTWSYNKDRSVWTFHIRENARWSNGDPLTAQDFVYSHKRILTADLGSEYSEMLYYLKNAEAYHHGDITDFSQVGVQALDDHLLRYTLVGPTAYFPQMLTHHSYWPVHRPTIEKFNAFADRSTAWARPGNLVGNGPFTLQKWVTNQMIEVDKNPYYWDADSVKLNKIRFLAIDNRDTAERMFLAGQVHKTDGIPFNKRKYYMDNRPDVCRMDSFFATSYMGVNVRKTHSPLDDVRVRQAIYMVINDNLINDNITHNGEEAKGFVPPLISGYDNHVKRKYNPEKARELLAEAGYPGGEGMRPLNFLIVNVDTNRTVAEVYQEMIRSELGIELNIVNQEWKVFLETLNQGDFDLYMMSWVGDYIDPTTFLGIMTEGNGNNHPGWGNKDYDRILKEAGQIGDPEKRYQKLAEAEDILMTELPVFPSSINKRIYLIDPRVKGWKSNPLDAHPYKFVSFDLQK
jgi:oligopeptide transport system substrate-binding protein